MINQIHKSSHKSLIILIDCNLNTDYGFKKDIINFKLIIHFKSQTKIPKENCYHMRLIWYMKNRRCTTIEIMYDLFYANFVFNYIENTNSSIIVRYLNIYSCIAVTNVRSHFLVTMNGQILRYMLYTLSQEFFLRPYFQQDIIFAYRI